MHWVDWPLKGSMLVTLCDNRGPTPAVTPLGCDAQALRPFLLWHKIDTDRRHRLSVGCLYTIPAFK